MSHQVSISRPSANYTQRSLAVGTGRLPCIRESSSVAISVAVVGQAQRPRSSYNRFDAIRCRLLDTCSMGGVSYSDTSPQLGQLPGVFLFLPLRGGTQGVLGRCEMLPTAYPQS